MVEFDILLLLAKMMRYIYSSLLYLFTPFLLLRLYWKGRKLPAYRQRVNERFTVSKTITGPIDLWLHAVSLGEVVAATPLIEALLKKQWRILITTMTPTGSQQVLNRFGQRVMHQYIPYDLPHVLRHFFKQSQPKIGVIMETELWPNMIYHANRAHIPLLIVNARISDPAFKSYIRVRFLFKTILNQLSAILAQSEEDARRFVMLGASPNIVHVLGNIKFDVQIQLPKNPAQEAVIAQWKQLWRSTRPLLLAASTHAGEEQQLLDHLKILQKAMPGLLLLIAPRHPERFQSVYQLAQQAGFKTALRSQPNQVETNTEIIIVDSLGELLGFYQISDYAFVGGSLVPIGGHNILEPIAMQVPVFCGPYVNNARAICNDLSNAGAIQCLENVDLLVKAIIHMAKNPTQRKNQITQANTILQANQGTMLRYLEHIEDLHNA